MSENQPAPDPDYQRRDLRERLLGLFEQTGEDRYLEAARNLFERGEELIGRDNLFLVERTNKNPAHRPPIDDENALMEMGRQVVVEGYTENRASHRIAETMPTGEMGSSKESIAERLRRKFRKDRRGRQEYSLIWKGVARLKVLFDYGKRLAAQHAAFVVLAKNASIRLRGMITLGSSIPIINRFVARRPPVERSNSAQFIRDYGERVRRREVFNSAQFIGDYARKLRCARRRD